ncbi:hypothetical protein M5689_000262 [Euphorbia peplus]|nr:hypothetical protein M5689_000262 [Euphorbia peplus]
MCSLRQLRSGTIFTRVVMKRKKVSKACGQTSRNEAAKAGQVEIQHSDVLAGSNVEVLNVYSRCAGLKLKGEARALSLYGKTNHKGLSDSDSYLNFDVDPDYEYFLINCSYYEWEQYWWDISSR